SFPVSVFGPQDKADPSKPEAGDGTKGGKEIRPGPPTQTSVPAGPEFIGRWVQAIREADARTGKRSVHQYILDNEPALWNHTHRDIRPEPLGYDELVQRTIDYGTAVRRADPDATIAGFAEWGWINYIYSAKDAENNYAKVDRRAHGDVPLIEYYLRKLREYEQRTGTRVIDVVDIHFYPSFNEGTHYTEDQKDPIRIRSVRSLWDPDYLDESWLKEKIRILPRMKEWIAADYPGRGISIGEWNYGGETRMSGGIATAEALGRYAQFGVTSAYYWTFPPANSPPMLAFLAYRNFDGKGGRFQDWYIPSTVGAGPVSLFASRDEEGKHLVAIAINQSSEFVVDARLDLSSCGALASRREFTVAKGMRSIAPGPVAGPSGPVVAEALPPYSITVVDVTLDEPMKGTLRK
ncbi:MAG: glycoside hydrolase family 44 protein, partial [Myxococcales bacterium]|nr:glycoside hydrolase family 44 protein [Myxococcales bacterium]